MRELRLVFYLSVHDTDTGILTGVHGLDCGLLCTYLMMEIGRRENRGGCSGLWYWIGEEGGKLERRYTHMHTFRERCDIFLILGVWFGVLLSLGQSRGNDEVCFRLSSFSFSFSSSSFITTITMPDWPRERTNRVGGSATCFFYIT